MHPNSEGERKKCGSGGFKEIIAEFPIEFKSLERLLAKELLGILFPIQDGALFSGTYNNLDKLYQPMVYASKRAIASYN